MGLEDFLGGLEDSVFVFVFLYFQHSNPSKWDWKIILGFRKSFQIGLEDFFGELDDFVFVSVFV